MKKIIVKKIEIVDLDAGSITVVTPAKALQEGAVRYHRSPVSSRNDFELRLDRPAQIDREPVGLLIKFLDLPRYDGVIRPVYDFAGGQTPIVDTLYVYVGERRETGMTARKWCPTEHYCLWDKQVRNWVHIWVFTHPVAFDYKRATGRGNVYSGRYVPTEASVN